MKKMETILFEVNRFYKEYKVNPTEENKEILKDTIDDLLKELE